jgi:hypothetical protein
VVFDQTVFGQTVFGKMAQTPPGGVEEIIIAKPVRVLFRMKYIIRFLVTQTGLVVNISSTPPGAILK